MRKLIIGLLTLGMLGGIFTFIPAGASRNFPDVNQVHPYFKAVETLALQDVVHGYPDGFFRPDDPVSRVEALKIAMLSSGKNVKNLKGDVNFPDVPDGIWYTPFVERAQKEGVMTGFVDGFFYPDQKITYMEALKIILRLNGLLEDYEPENDDELWFLPYLKAANDHGLMEPIMAKKPEVLARNQFVPASWITRGEISYLAFEIYTRRTELQIHAKTLKRVLTYKPFNKYEEIDLKTRTTDENQPKKTQIVGKYERAQEVAKAEHNAVITQRGIDLTKQAYQLSAFDGDVMYYWRRPFQHTGLTLEEWYMLKVSEVLKKKRLG